ncbi:MAG TPA: hypothetical protein VMW56_22840 [Candidatus Margulisiibacteriota bacterium]|nr:hypothetical protein [Candidatus Margulisiibacteriota bacterium]
MKRLRSIFLQIAPFALIASLFLSVPARAQVSPTPVFGLELKTNDSLGVSISGTAYLKWNNSAGQLQLSPSTGSYQNVISILTSPSPSSHNVVYWSGSNWVPQQLTQDDIAAAFTITLSASGFSTTQACGATITNPQFTLTRNQVPSSASLQDNTDTQSFTPTLTTIGYGGAANTFGARSYTVTTVNGTRTWTLSMTNSASITKTATVTATYSPHVYFGMAVPGTINSAFITGLSNNAIATTSVPRTISYGAGGNTMAAYYAIPATYTTPTTFTDTTTGFGIPFSQVGTNVSVTDECGTGNNINFNVFASDNLLNAAFNGKWQ